MTRRHHDARRRRAIGLAAPLMLLAAASCAGDDGTGVAGPGSGGEVEASSGAVAHEDHPHDHGAAVVVHAGPGADGRYEIHYAEREGEEVFMIEASTHPPGDTPTAAQERAATDFVDEVRAATDAYQRVEDALAAGFSRWPGIDPYHVVHPTHATDGRLLDPGRPEFLMYDDDGRLVAAMFLAAGNELPGTQFGGPLTVWHHHPWGPSCWTAGGVLPTESEPDGPGSCPAGLLYAERSPEMLHVWIVDHPEGPYSSDMGQVLLQSR